MKEEKQGMGDKSRSLPVDPNLPRCVCQNCRHSLCDVGVHSYADKFFNDYSSLFGNQSNFAISFSFLFSCRFWCETLLSNSTQNSFFSLVSVFWVIISIWDLLKKKKTHDTSPLWTGLFFSKISLHLTFK